MTAVSMQASLMWSKSIGGENGVPNPIPTWAHEGCKWSDPIQKIRRKFGIGGANCRHPIDLYNMPIVPRKANDAILYGSLN